MNNGLTAANILSVLPDVLQADENMLALASAISSVLADRAPEISNLSIYSRIDQLPEELLDILAYDFKCDWWDYEYSIEEKRQTLKKCWYIHKHKGTPSAVETALSAIYPDSKIEEWFDYGGEPYHFRIVVQLDEASVDPVKHARVISLVNYYKNLRSVLDCVIYRGSTGEAAAYAGAALLGEALMHSAAAGWPELSRYVDECGNHLIDEDQNYLAE